MIDPNFFVFVDDDDNEFVRNPGSEHYSNYMNPEGGGYKKEQDWNR